MISLDFGNLIRQLDEAPVCTQRDLSIWGGDFDTADLAAFLQAWDLARRDMPWRIWEWVSRSAIQWKTEPDDIELLERARLFGPGGDFSLRRENDLFLWHFVGPGESVLPTGFRWEHNRREAEPEPQQFRASDYWQSRSEGWALQVHARHVLLWGQERQDEQQNPLGTWHDARVGRVPKLEYPGLTGRDPQGRVKLCYREYLQGDNLEAVWWLNLKGLNEPCEEGSDE
jgi:hypothetical protein